jgi:nitrogen regulatory protein P-II 1
MKLKDYPGVTVSGLRGFGRARAVGARHAVLDENVEYVKRSKLEIVVPNDLAEIVVEMIRTKVRTGNPADGKIFVYTVDDVVRIRTGESRESGI